MSLLLASFFNLKIISNIFSHSITVLVQSTYVLRTSRHDAHLFVLRTANKTSPKIAPAITYSLYREHHLFIYLFIYLPRKSSLNDGDPNQMVVFAIYMTLGKISLAGWCPAQISIFDFAYSVLCCQITPNILLDWIETFYRENHNKYSVVWALSAGLQRWKWITIHEM